MSYSPGVGMEVPAPPGSSLLSKLRVLLAELRHNCWVGGAEYPRSEASCVAGTAALGLRLRLGIAYRALLGSVCCALPGACQLAGSV
jgi:hypothetical protein